MEQSAPGALVEHFFRHESGRLVAVLLRRFGAHRLEAIEDAIQFALMRALGTWTRHGIPDEPSAWLTRVANNQLIDQLRRAKVAEAFSAHQAEQSVVGMEGAVEDTLVLLFACADDRLAPRTRLVLCLKLLCGFSTEEIALRLFMSTANVQKNLERGRESLKAYWADHAERPTNPNDAQARLGTVQLVLYLQFNEGYTLSAEATPLRSEVCDEAIRLTRLLVGHPIGNQPSTWALLALMHFHASRLPARLDAEGRFVPLQQQDRSRWDRRHIELGFAALHEATRSTDFSRYHGEAAIQVEHVIAKSFEETRWNEIVALYEALERVQPSPVYALNRAIAIAEAQGPEAGLAALDAAALPTWFQDNHLLLGTRGELLHRSGRWTEAQPYLMRARDAAPSEAERRHYDERLQKNQK
jgi:RNA polymerase sigma factor (sigma-70 family)